MTEQDTPKDRTWQNNTEQAPMEMERFEKDMQTKNIANYIKLQCPKVWQMKQVKHLMKLVNLNNTTNICK